MNYRNKIWILGKACNGGPIFLIGNHPILKCISINGYKCCDKWLVISNDNALTYESVGAQTIFKVLVPVAMVNIWQHLRATYAIGWASIILVEGFGPPRIVGETGIGFFMVDMQRRNIMDQYFAALLARFYNGVDSFPLLAVPFFILAGELMNAGGITRSIVNFSLSLVGHVRGGLAQVNILSSMLFAGISGSAVADASAIGKMLVPEMVHNGYRRSFAAGVPFLNMQQFLYFFPLPQGQGSLRPTFFPSRLKGSALASGAESA